MIILNICMLVIMLTIKDSGVFVLADQIKLSQLNDLLSKSYYSLMIDETTDIAVLNEMVIYCCYVSNNSVKTAFLKIAELFPECIEKTLL